MFRALVLAAATALSASALAQTSTSPTSAAPASKAAAKASTAAAGGEVVATVNGKPIKESQLDFVVKQIGKGDSPEIRERVRDMLIDRELLMQEARRSGVAEREDVKFGADNAARSVVIQALLRQEVEAHKPTEEQIKAEYEREVKLSGDKEYKVHHILVDSEGKAKEIIARLDKGEKFEDLAKGTKDVGSAARGGELDWAPPGAYVKEFSEAMVKLEKGKYTTTPVQSKFGWHVIRLDDVRAIQPPPLEQVRQHIVESLEQRQAQEYVESLKKKATITLK